MKRIAFLAALVAASLLTGCKAQESSPSALDVIMTRTSIRSFTGEAVSKDQLETILKAGMAAPTAMNGQPWRFVVVTDQDKIKETFGAGPRSEMFTTAGAVIVVCGQTSSMGKPFGQPDGPEVEMPNMFWYEDCSAAAENILLAAHALGLGAVWTGVYPNMERCGAVANVIGTPEYIIPLCVVYAGYPDEQPAPKQKYDPERVSYNAYGSR